MGRRAFLGGVGALGAGAVVVGFDSAASAANDAGPIAVGAHAADVSHQWMATLFDAVLAEGLTPPNAARTYAYCAIAMYETAVPGMAGFRPLAGQLTRLDPLPQPRSKGRIDWPLAVSKAAHVVASELFAAAQPSTLAALDARHADVRADRAAAGVPRPLLDKAEAYGARAGNAFVHWARSDGYAKIIGKAYTPPTGDSMWVSTPPNFGTAIEPHWAKIRPLVLRGAGEVEPAPHIPFSSEPGSAFRAQADTVYAVSQGLTDEHRAIARFWTDNPRSSGLPSGHWHMIASHLSRLRGDRLDQALEVQARAGIALHDAFLDCWTWKYRLNLLRPVTYVRRYMDPAWTTLVNTPQFPEYTSGHSVASGAVATVLTDLFGTVAFTDSTHEVRNLPARSFPSIWAAAHEAAQSRIYGGIHYPMGIENGVDQGSAIGALVLRRLRTRR